LAGSEAISRVAAHLPTVKKHPIRTAIACAKVPIAQPCARLPRWIWLAKLAKKQETPIVRISLGRFDADKHDTIRKLLDDSQKTLIPAIRALKGNRAYYVGIDRENNAMTNVSVWDTRGDAEQMASLQPGEDFYRRGCAFRKTRHQSRNALDDVTVLDAPHAHGRLWPLPGRATRRREGPVVEVTRK
jgi:hypothetical protein